MGLDRNNTSQIENQNVLGLFTKVVSWRIAMYM